MDNTTIIVVAVIVVIALLLLFLLRGRTQRVSFGDAGAPAKRVVSEPRTDLQPASVQPANLQPANLQPEGHGVGSEVAAAFEDVVDQFIGLDAHPSGGVSDGPGDTLTQLKGLGAKAATRLRELGVTRFDQIAAWDDGDVAAIDAQMGAFKGRIRRDRWVDQAKLLAKGEIEMFEAEFGKLGG